METKRMSFRGLLCIVSINIEGCQDSPEATTSDNSHSERVLSVALGPGTCIVSGALHSKALNLAAQQANSPEGIHLAVLVQTQVAGVRRLGSLHCVSILPINWGWHAQAAHGRECGLFVLTTTLGLGRRCPGSHGKKRIPNSVLQSRPGSGSRLC